MKRYAYIWILAFLLMADVVGAQDMQRFSERHITGTARYVSMGGAMNAIGGDPSAVLDNPAGLGLYRRSEIALTLEETIDRTQQLNAKDAYQRLRFALPHASAIWSWGNQGKQRGIIYSNLMFSINRLANYNRDIVINGVAMGMLETMRIKTNGLPANALENQPWDDENIGWLSILGYEGKLIKPIEGNQWIPTANFTEGTLEVVESGTADQYTLSWAGNFNYQWYLGFSLNVPTLTYTKHMALRETDRINSATLKSMYHVSGVGVGASLGIIYRPLQWLRIGASFQTPTWMSMSMQTEGDLYTTIAGNKYEILTPSSGVMSYEVFAPLRTSVGIAGQLKNRGLLSLQYDYAHATEMEDVHTLRAGAELQVYRGVFLDAGYVYESSFMKEEPIVALNYDAIVTDTDYRYTTSSQYASLGIGYRHDVVVAQVAYQYRWQTLHQYATEVQTMPIDVYAQTHRVVASFAWRF